MPSIAGDVRHELEIVDFTEALEHRILCVAAKGIHWEDAPSPSLARTQSLDLYYYMALTRAVDYEVVKLMRKGFAFGKHPMAVGNEAIAVGAASALRGDEWAMVAIRDLGVFLVRGVTPASILAQACGRMNGLTNGWDGSLHMGSREHRIAGLVSHLGTLLPVGVGCAFAERYRGSDVPVVAFIGEGTTSTGDDYVVPIGSARIVREGTDASIVSYGSQVFRALEAARRIQNERGASVEVVDLRTIVPFDREMLRASVRKTNRALVTCEAPKTGAFGNSIVAAIVNDCFDCLDAPVALVAAADTPVPFAPSLEAAHLPTVEKLVAAAYRLLEY